MTRFLRETFAILKEAVNDWLKHNAPEQGAALAFYSLLSIAPLLVIAIAIAAAAFGEKAARGELVEQMQGMVGPQGAKALEALIDNASQPQAGILATVLGMATLLFGASGVFGQLRASLNTIWEVPPRQESGIWEIVRGRFLSFAMVLGIGFLLLTTLVLSAVLSAASEYMKIYLPGTESILQWSNTLLSFAVVTLLFALIFRLLPDTNIAWRDVWIGALLTAMLFTVGKSLIGWYLGTSGMASAYGTAGSLVVVIVWVYYSSQIMFFGAELTHVYACRYGSRIGEKRGPRCPGSEANASEPSGE